MHPLASEISSVFVDQIVSFGTSVTVSPFFSFAAMLDANAQMLVYNNLGLPSPVAYIPQGNFDVKIHWDIAYFYDNMREQGHANEGAFKFYKLLSDFVGAKRFLANQLGLRSKVPRHCVKKTLLLKVVCVCKHF